MHAIVNHSKMGGWSSVLRPLQHSIGYMGDGFYIHLRHQHNSYSCYLTFWNPHQIQTNFYHQQIVWGFLLVEHQPYTGHWSPEFRAGRISIVNHSQLLAFSVDFVHILWYLQDFQACVSCGLKYGNRPASIFSETVNVFQSFTNWLWKWTWLPLDVECLHKVLGCDISFRCV